MSVMMMIICQGGIRFYQVPTPAKHRSCALRKTQHGNDH